jgi:hypothetical protein
LLSAPVATTKNNVQILILEGKKLDRISKIVVLPLKSQTILMTAVRSFISFLHTYGKDDRDLYTTGVVEEANREWQDFHASCSWEVARLNSYPTGQDLSEVYWRPAFFDYEGQLHVKYGNLFEDYPTCISETFKIGKEVIIQREVSSSAVPFYLSALVTLLGWTISKTLRRGIFLPRFRRRLSWMILWPGATFAINFLMKLTHYAVCYLRLLPRFRVVVDKVKN